MTTLTFRPCKELKELAQITLKCTQFKLPYEDKYTKEKGMYFVKDEGIYLMNAYKKSNLVSSYTKKNRAIYAFGYNPKTNEDYYEDCRYAVGGDDFAEFIPFSKEQLQRIMNGGNVTIKIIETGEQGFDMEITA